MPASPPMLCVPPFHCAPVVAVPALMHNSVLVTLQYFHHNRSRISAITCPAPYAISFVHLPVRMNPHTRLHLQGAAHVLQPRSLPAPVGPFPVADACLKSTASPLYPALSMRRARRCYTAAPPDTYSHCRRCTALPSTLPAISTVAAGRLRAAPFSCASERRRAADKPLAAVLRPGTSAKTRAVAQQSVGNPATLGRFSLPYWSPSATARHLYHLANVQ